MNLRKCLLTKNECYLRNIKIKPCGVMVHSTGANNPWLKRYVQPDDGRLGTNTAGTHWNQFRPGGRQVCVHAFIGKLQDGTIATYQTLPWDIRGWHSGVGRRGSANNLGYIGFEICEDGLNDRNYFNKVYKEAVELTAYLCRMYHFNPDTQVICHSEGHTKGIASNHSDVMHWFPKHGKTMDIFRRDVKQAMRGTVNTSQKPVNAAQTKLDVYKVKVTTPVLNIRSGPGTAYTKVGQIRGMGIYTVIQESSGPGASKWGRLKSGAGWISLDYVKKV